MSVDRLRGLERAATPAPWHVSGDEDSPAVGNAGNVAPAPWADIELIVEARNMLPALLDIAEAAAEICALVRPPWAPDPEWDDMTAKAGTKLRAALARLDRVPSPDDGPLTASLKKTFRDAANASLGGGS